MIKHVSLAVNLRDGFRERVIQSGVSLSFLLDGEPVQPIRKEDGWCVFIDLCRGEHSLRIESREFAPYRLFFHIESPDTFYREEYVTLEPTPAYPFGRAVQQATVTFTKEGRLLANQQVFFTSARKQPLKLAQDGASAGLEKLKLFSPQKPASLGLPGRFLVDDGAKSEVVTILEGQAEGGFLLGTPLRHPHNRGAAFRQIREYRTDGQGGIFLAMDDLSGLTAYLENGEKFLWAQMPEEGVEGSLCIDFKGGKKHGLSGDA